jgi:hypothetical protein
MSSALVLPLIAALEKSTEGVGMSKWAFGIFAFAALAGLLAITLIFGKGRPHS